MKRNILPYNAKGAAKNLEATMIYSEVKLWNDLKKERMVLSSK